MMSDCYRCVGESLQWNVVRVESFVDVVHCEERVSIHDRRIPRRRQRWSAERGRCVQFGRLEGGVNINIGSVA